MTNLVQLADQLKNLSDQQLQQVQGNQSVPPYLLVSEMARREQMRKAAQAQQQGPQQPPTVAQQVASQFQQMARPGPQQGAPQGMPGQPGQPPAGLAGLSPRGMPMPTPNGAPQMPGPPQMGAPAMRGGGIVALAGGDVVDDPNVDVPAEALAGPYTANPGILAAMGSAQAEDNPDFRWIPRANSPRGLPMTLADWKAGDYAKIPDISEVRRMLEAIRGKDYLTPMEAEIAALQAKAMKSKPGGSLMALGLGMAASRNPTFAGALGESGLAALQRNDQLKQQQDAMGLALMRERGDLGRAQQQREEQRLHNVLGAWEKMGADVNVTNQALNTNRERMAEIQARSDLANSQQEAQYQQKMALVKQINPQDYPAAIDQIASRYPQVAARYKTALALAIKNGDAATAATRAQSIIMQAMKDVEDRETTVARTDPNAPPALGTTKYVPKGSVSVDGMVFPSQAAADAYRKETGR